MVLALVLIIWSITPLYSGVVDTSALSNASDATAAATNPTSTDVLAFTCRPDRPDHDSTSVEDPSESVAEREDSSSFKAGPAELSMPLLPFFTRNGHGFGVDVIRPHDGFLPLIQTVLLRC